MVRAGLGTTLAAAVVLLATIQPTLAEGSFKVAMAILGVGMGLIFSQLGNVVQSSVDASGHEDASLKALKVGLLAAAFLALGSLAFTGDLPHDPPRARDQGDDTAAAAVPV